MKKFCPYIALLTAMLLWAGSPIVIKATLAVFSPLCLVTLRFSIAVLLMLIIGLASRKLQKINRKDVPVFLLAGLFQPFLYYIFESYGLQLMSSPTIAEVLLSTSPLIAPLMAYLLIHERVTLWNILGIVLSTAGVILMVICGNTQFHIGSPWGILMCFLAVLAAVLYTICLRRIPVQYNNLTTVFWVQGFGLLLFIPTYLILSLTTGDWGVQYAALSLQGIGGLLYLAVFASITCYLLFCYAVRIIGVTRANAFNNARPVFTALIMLVVFNEQLPLIKWVAIALVIIGLFVSNIQRQNKIKRQSKSSTKGIHSSPTAQIE